jgi:FkbM family methyltransferase
MGFREFVLRILRRFWFLKIIYQIFLRNKLNNNRSFLHFNNIYSSFTLKEKRIFHGLTSRLFFDKDIPPGIDVNWETSFNGEPFYIKLKSDSLNTDWHTAVSLEGTDTEIKNFYKILLNSKLKPKSFFDVGANFCTHSMFFLIHKVKTISFEPNPFCHEVAEKISKSNNLNLKIENVGIGSEKGTKLLTFPKNDTGLGSFNSNNMLNDNLYSNIDKINCDIITLDEFVEKNNNIPDLIKIDTEGYEYSVLLGSKKIIKENNPMIVFESIEIEQRKLISEFLASLNYVIYDLSSLKLFSSGDEYYNSKSINFLAAIKNHPVNDVI